MPSCIAERGAFALLLVGSVLATGVAPVSAQEVMTNETVIQMVRAGLSDGVILAKIRSSPTRFDTRTEALIALKKAGVSENVMSAIVGGGAPQASAGARSSAAAGSMAAIPPAGRKGPVFHASGGKLVLPGNRARYRTAERQPVFLCSADPGEMPLVRLQPGSNDRNLKYSSSSRAPYAGSTTQKGIRTEDRIDVEAERDQGGLFRIRPRAPLPPGEYAFVLTRSSGTIPSGTVYDFGID